MIVSVVVVDTVTVIAAVVDTLTVIVGTTTLAVAVRALPMALGTDRGTRDPDEAALGTTRTRIVTARS